MNEATTALVTIATGILGVAFLAVLVSRNANTPGVLSAGGSAFAQALGAATAPVTGASSGVGAGSIGNIQAPFGNLGLGGNW